MRQSRPKRVRHGAFTLIELMVVIGIIIVLVGILTPTIRGILERVRSSLCLNNLKQMALAHRKYAGNQIRQGLYAPGSATIDGAVKKWPNPEVIWLKDGVDDPDVGLFRGQGILAKKELIKPEVMYCPNWDTETWLPGKKDDAGKGGWVQEDLAKNTLQAIVSTYNYRGTFGGAQTKWRPAQDETDGDALMADQLVMKKNPTDSNYSSFLQHDPYTGVVFFDCHAELMAPTPPVKSPPYTAFRSLATWGAGGTAAMYTTLETVFSTYLSKR